MVYINSSFLSQFISEKAVSLLYIIGSLATIVALVVIPIILRRFGNYATLITFTILEFLILFAMAFVREATIIVPLFMAHWVVSQIMLINIDVFFESSQKKESDTGSKRAILLTIINLALILSILLVGFILKDDEFWKVYLMSAVILIPFLLIILIKFRKLKDPIYESHKILTTVKRSGKVRQFVIYLYLNFS